MNKVKIASWVFAVAGLPFPFFGVASTPQEVTMIDLAGEWCAKLPAENNDGSITLPGTTDMAGYGIPLDKDSVSRDEQFRRLTRKNSFIGNAVYSREIEIPKSMAGKPLELQLERVLWKSEAKIDGRPLENVEYSLVAPHRHIFKEGLSEGRHTLEIEIDNTKQYDISFNNLAHAYTNDTQTMWNGILGDMTLSVIPDFDISEIEVYPSPSTSEVKVKARIDNNTDKAVTEDLKFEIDGNPVSSKKVRLMPGLNIIEETFPAAGLELWNEFNPVLYQLSISANDGRKNSVKFGMREVDNKNGLRVNGIPVFLRGTLECCVFPLTGVPPTNKDGWQKTFATAKEWGLNHLRFHSWCPPEAAFEVADSLGFYLQVELPVWSLKIGDDEKAENFLKNEYEKIVVNYGNHPSFLLMSVGNELQHDFSWLNQMVREMKERDPRHLYTATSFTFEKGHGGHPEPYDDFLVTQWTDNGWVRGQGVFEEEPPSFNHNYSSSLTGIDVPLVSHEIGQYAVYPHLSEIEKYKGVLEPLNFKAIKADLEDKGLLGKSEEMTQASGKLAALLYKEEIERALKTPGMSGFQLLGLQDFPGQGTALVGLLDAFWDNKGAADIDWFRQFNNSVVPLLNFDAAVYDSAGAFEAEALLANYSDNDIDSDRIEWSLTKRGEKEPFATGSIDAKDVKAGSTVSVGRFSVPLNGIDNPSAVEVRLKMNDNYMNSWQIYVYPQTVTKMGDVVCTQSLDVALKALEEGRKVLLSPAMDNMNGLESKFLPVFWSPVHFPKQAGTMGIINNPKHPALAAFPNEGHTDWQWWRPVKRAKVINLDSIPNVDPIVGVIDNFVNNRRLGYIFEAKCGSGKLVFSSIDLFSPESNVIETNALENSLLNYMNGDLFMPQEDVPTEFLRQLMTDIQKSTHSSATDIYE